MQHTSCIEFLSVDNNAYLVQIDLCPVVVLELELNELQQKMNK